MLFSKRLVITVDGPAGAGKSTVSKILAEQLGYTYLDTGAIYRSLAYIALKKGLQQSDEKEITKMAESLIVEFKDGRKQRVIANGEDITDVIRCEDIGMFASGVSALPGVRRALLHLQRNIGNKGGVVAEGRDMGTVVFPDADIKFYLIASGDERIRRRHQELANRGEEQNIDEIRRELLKRDRQDSERPLSPLKPAEDAITIDSTRMDIISVTEKMIDEIIKKTGQF